MLVFFEILCHPIKPDLVPLYLPLDSKIVFLSFHWKSHLVILCVTLFASSYSAIMKTVIHCTSSLHFFAYE